MANLRKKLILANYNFFKLAKINPIKIEVASIDRNFGEATRLCFWIDSFRKERGYSLPSWDIYLFKSSAQKLFYVIPKNLKKKTIRRKFPFFLQTWLNLYFLLVSPISSLGVQAGKMQLHFFSHSLRYFLACSRFDRNITENKGNSTK